ncbi:WhiB family transcriptional regulator [Actinomycetospora lutea]|uniref:WhiB family transcriptional regulator n=1 Tax=Actinomycetospora lutea TaxID=663604 RepID=UPI0023672290|nr:WhiB family transcriptional regulator [Actinomycetospora lutea]MDD7942562.1 WhiB family transcriptional regulator [Actinomycetospora lutea]
MADVSRLPAAVVEYWDWQRHAACRGMDLAVFFHPDGEREPSRGRRVDGAKQVCASCPVMTACRDWARSVQEPYGVWGGESEDERRTLLARRRREPRTTPAA